MEYRYLGNLSARHEGRLRLSQAQKRYVAFRLRAIAHFADGMFDDRRSVIGRAMRQTGRRACRTRLDGIRTGGTGKDACRISRYYPVTAFRRRVIPDRYINNKMKRTANRLIARSPFFYPFIVRKGRRFQSRPSSPRPATSVCNRYRYRALRSRFAARVRRNPSARTATT